MKIETKWWLDRLTELKNNSINSYEKRMYSKQIKNIKEGNCPYGCIKEKDNKK